MYQTTVKQNLHTTRNRRRSLLLLISRLSADLLLGDLDALEGDAAGYETPPEDTIAPYPDSLTSRTPKNVGIATSNRTHSAHKLTL
jgi:hypothetical protein